MSSLTRLRVRILVPPHTARTEDRVQKLRTRKSSDRHSRHQKPLQAELTTMIVNHPLWQ